MRYALDSNLVTTASRRFINRPTETSLKRTSNCLSINWQIIANLHSAYSNFNCKGFVLAYDFLVSYQSNDDNLPGAIFGGAPAIGLACKLSSPPQWYATSRR